MPLSAISFKAYSSFSSVLLLMCLFYASFFDLSTILVNFFAIFISKIIFYPNVRQMFSHPFSVTVFFSPVPAQLNPQTICGNLTKGGDANVDSRRSDCCYQFMLNSFWTWLRNRMQSRKKITAPASQTERLFS